ALERKVKAGLIEAEAAAEKFLSWISPFASSLPDNHVQKKTETLAKTKAVPEKKDNANTNANPNGLKTSPGSGGALQAAGKSFHDGGADKVLGAGDEVFEYVNGLNHIVQAFPSSPEGMVEAALYELHRGDKRSMADIMADHSAKRWERGADAAIEQTTKGDWTKGKGLNDDGTVSDDGKTG